VKDSSEKSSELEQKKFSFGFRPAQKRSEPIAEVDVAETENTAGSAASPEVTSTIDVSTEAAEIELPGAVLAAERRRRRFSIADIANQLFLTEKQISALENDDYDHFPAQIFVTGYLRNYARLLGLPSDPLIELFKSQSAQSAPALDSVSHTTDRVATSKESFDSRIVMAVIVSLVVAGLLWWGISSEPDMAKIEDVAVVDDVSIVTSEPITTVTTAAVEPEIETVEIVPPEKVVEPVNPVEMVKEVPAVTNSASEEEVVDAAPPVPEFIADRAAAQSFPDSMVLTFSAESWVEITDVNERRVMFGLGKPGQTRALSGTAPFKILFGYSPAVKMTFNGEPFDQSSLTRGKIARFTLGNNSE
jgi:cytoskeleton protein RodZ